MKFIKNVKKEMQKVKWPEKKYMTKYTIATIAVVLFFALYFYGLNVVIALVKGLR